MSNTGLALVPIIGTLTEKMDAYKQIAANAVLSRLLPKGWDTTAKGIAGCWAADALGVHPISFMQGVWPIDMGADKGIVMTPKWEFENGLLRSRLPGFRVKVTEETTEACEITMFSVDEPDGITVRYTLDDAKRQGLYTRNAKTWEPNIREMLYKQTFHRCAKRIGAHVLMGLPAGAGTLEPADDVQHEPSGATVVETGPASEASQPAAAATTAEPAPKEEDPRVTFGKTIVRYYGGKKMKPAEALAKAVLIYNQWLLEITGVDQQTTFKAVSEIGTDDARKMTAWLEARIEAGMGPAAEPAKAAPAPEPEHAPASSAEVATDEAPPPAEDEDMPLEEEPEPEPEHEMKSLGDDPRVDGSFEGLMLLVVNGRKVLGTEIVKEAPPGSGKLYFTHTSIATELGHTSAVKLKENGTVVADRDAIKRLAVALRRRIAEKEGTGR